MSTTLLILNAGRMQRGHLQRIEARRAIARRSDEKVRVFLMGDAAHAAHRNQKVPQGYYNVETMLAACCITRRSRCVRQLHGCPRHSR